MPLFKYKAASADGKISEVLIEGDSQADSLNRLRSRNMTPLESFGQVESYTHQRTFSFSLRRDFNLYDFTNRLVPLLKAHIQLERALGILADGTEDEKTKHIINDLRRGLHEGKKLSALIRDQGSRFPAIYSNLVEAGEESGSLTEVMIELQRFLNDGKEMKDFMITSSIYPMIILSVTTVVVILLFVFFIPHFAKIFIEMGKELPLPTKIMLGISQFVSRFWWLWLLCASGVAFFIYKVKKGGAAKDWWDDKLIKLPVAGKIVKTMEVCRFIRTLAVLINNHVHLLNTIRISSHVIQNRHIFKSLSSVASELRGGTKLSGALERSEYMPKTAIQMLRIGEESGNMGEMLNQVADHYENDLKVKIKRLLALFEPAVILFLAVVIFIVVISIFLAIMEMNQI
jgi:type II secretory pathway component PulF